MMLRSLAWGLLGVGTLTIASACGGVAVFSPDGDGGGGGTTSGPGPGPTSTTTGGPTSTNSVTTGGPTSVCQTFCAALEEPCAIDNCFNNCLSSYGPTCEKELDSLYLCFADAPVGPGCDIPPGACQSENDAYAFCLNGNQDCFTEWCAGNECICGGQCFGAELVAECESFGQSNCNCYYDMQYIGSCNGFTCELEGSCCYDLLFLDGKNN